MNKLNPFSIYIHSYLRKSDTMLLDQIVYYNPLSRVINQVFNKSALLTNFAQYFTDLFLKNTEEKNVSRWLFLSGVTYITWRAFLLLQKNFKIFGWMPKHMKNKADFSEEKFCQRYGSTHGKSIVLVTGGADGIGLAFSHRFAKMGFNLIITDINEQKLQRRKREIQQRYGIEVITRALDMSNPEKLHNFVEQIQTSFGDKIRIIVNNVGMTAGGQYLTIDPERMKTQIYLNFYPMFEINKVMIPRLRNNAYKNGEDKRSAIINLASATGVYYSPAIGAYSASKHLADIYSRTISQQNKDKVDVISVRPYGVITNMMQMRKQERMITPKQCVQSVIWDLYGHQNATFSGAPHKIMAGFFSTMKEEQYIQLYVQAFKKKKDQ